MSTTDSTEVTIPGNASHTVRALGAIELDTADDPRTSEASSLPSADGGLAAWRLLLVAFVFEALLWGFPLSFGVFQDYYSKLPEFKNSRYISVVGTTASGISYLGAPIAIPLVRRWSNYRTRMILIGWPLCIVGLVAGSFANQLSTLILTQGKWTSESVRGVL
jgi:hypothetical protein